MKCSLLILTLFVVGSHQQEPTLRCELDSLFRITAFSSSYYDRSSKYRCTFQSIKSIDDFKNAQTRNLSLNALRVSALIFQNSSLSQLPDKMFASFSNTKTLDLSRLGLDDVASSAFFNLMPEQIDLSNNKLTKLNQRTFSNMQIKLLDLGTNLIEAIDDSAFTNADIQKLVLSFNRLKSIKFLSFFKFFNVLELNDNLIQTFDKIEAKQDGWSSRLSGWVNSEYPKIYLQKNQLTKISCESSIQINTLNLEENPLLTEVVLNDCLIDQLDVSDCDNLQRLSLNDNLEGLTAKNVKLTDFGSTSMKSLTSLSLANSTLAPNVFEKIMKMENLTLLDLSGVPIGPLNVSTFAKLKSLQFLYLKATNISNIQFGTFSHQHVVKIFDISDNLLGNFDMNMIFSMSSLLSLDLSGNELHSLDNVESAHFTFTLLQKIDLSNNEWSCSYLMKLIKIFRIYKVSMSRSNLEEIAPNIHGVACIHIVGEDDIIGQLSPENSNVTDLRDKMNEMIAEITKNSQFRISVDSRLSQLESRLDNQIQTSATSAAVRSEKPQDIEVRNGALLEIALTIVCIICSIYVAIKVFTHVKRNFLSRPRTNRSNSEHTLTMSVDDY